MRKIYLASSWRNEQQGVVVRHLRAAGHQVYDFKFPNDPQGPFPNSNPEPEGGFHWSNIDPNWKDWSVTQYRRHLRSHPLAAEGYERDMKGMRWADTFVLLLRCGSSAHLEAGWACGWRDRCDLDVSSDGSKQVYALIPKQTEPELMYRMLDGIFENVEGLLQELQCI